MFNNLKPINTLVSIINNKIYKPLFTDCGTIASSNIYLVCLYSQLILKCVKFTHIEKGTREQGNKHREGTEKRKNGNKLNLNLALSAPSLTILWPVLIFHFPIPYSLL